MNEHEKFAEELIERELERAGEAEPLAGLEERLLGKVQQQPERRVRWWWIAAPAMAALLLVTLIYWRPAEKPKVADQPPPVSAPAPSPEPQQAVAVTREPQRPRQERRTQVAAVAVPTPKQEVFPAPAPLSEEEKVLVAFARRRPEDAEEVAEQQKKPVEKVTIASIKIEPLVPEEQTNGIE